MEKVVPEVWERMQTLFHLCADRSGEELERVLAEACPEPGMRGEVMQLVLASRPESSLGGVPLRERETAQGGRFGAYTIIRHLGTGGTGTVFLAEQRTGASVQKVALKVFPGYDSESFFSRSFGREEAILAALTHPSIPRLLDVGVSAGGEPFLVMEFAAGEPLDVFCDTRRLGVEARLALILRVCDAVAYAHRNLVVHLDLKPNNLLGSMEEPQISLLDFGTSKLLEGGRTLAIAQMATPAYAAPEQLRGEPTTTSCDVFGLGAVLFELLAGRRAFPNVSMAALAERSGGERALSRLESAVTDAAAENRGLSPAALRRQLRGDLSTIVAKCLAALPADRYSSVDALAEDLRRYLAGRPVQARRQTVVYQLKKFARRNRFVLSAAALVLLLLAGTGGYAYERQQRALEQGRRAEQMQAFLSQLIHLANARETGKPSPTVTDFLDLGVKVLPELIRDPGDRRAAQLSLGESMYDSRDFARALGVLEDVARSAAAAKDAETEAEASAIAGLCAFAIGNMSATDRLTGRGLLLAHARGVGPGARIWAEGAWGYTHSNRTTDLAQSEALLGAAVEESRSAGVPERERLWVLEKLAWIYEFAGDLPPASKLANEAYAIVQSHPYALCDRAFILEFQANLVTIRGDDAGSLPMYQQAVEAAAQCSGPTSSYTLTFENWMARAMINTGQNAQAIALLETNLPLWRKTEDQAGMAIDLIFLARANLKLGHFEQTEAYARAAIEAQQGKVAPTGLNMAMCHLLIAQSLAGREHYRAALAEAELTNRMYSNVSHMSPIQESYHAQARDLLQQLASRTESTAAPALRAESPAH